MSSVPVTYPVNKIEVVNKSKHNIWEMRFEHMYPSYDTKQYIAQILEEPLIAYAMVSEYTAEGFAYHVILIKVTYNNGMLKIVFEDIDDSKLLEINGKWGDYPGCCDSRLLDFVKKMVNGLTGTEGD